MSIMRAQAAAAVLAVSVLALSACTDDAAKPKPLESSSAASSSSATASSSPSASAPSLPPEAKGTDEASAEAFVGYWIKTLNYDANSGDASGLRSASDHRCVACTAIIRLIENTASQGGRIDGKGWDLKSSEVNSQGNGIFLIDAVVHVNAQTLVPKAGAQRQRFPGGMRHKKFRLQVKAKSLAVTRLEQPE